MCIGATCHLNKDIRDAIEQGIKTEQSEVSKGVLKNLIDNADIADRKEVPICQDTGKMAQTGVEIILKKIHYPGVGEHIMIPHTFEPGESVKQI